jgi:hypothetical protein
MKENMAAYSDQFVQAQRDYWHKHLHSGTAADRHIIRARYEAFEIERARREREKGGNHAA